MSYWFYFAVLISNNVLRLIIGGIRHVVVDMINFEVSRWYLALRNYEYSSDVMFT